MISSHNRVNCVIFGCSFQSCPTGPFNEDFFKAMSEMSLDGASDGELDFLPLMQGMMENLLSKDVLYPSLKDLQEKASDIIFRPSCPHLSDNRSCSCKELVLDQLKCIVMFTVSSGRIV